MVQKAVKLQLLLPLGSKKIKNFYCASIADISIFRLQGFFILVVFGPSCCLAGTGRQGSLARKGWSKWAPSCAVTEMKTWDLQVVNLSQPLGHPLGTLQGFCYWFSQIMSWIKFSPNILVNIYGLFLWIKKDLFALLLFHLQSCCN